MKIRVSKGRIAAIGGLSTALVIVLLYSTNIFAFNKISLLAAVSLIIGVVIIEGGFYTALIAYLASSFLSFFLLPNKAVAFGFILFAGLYPLIRHGATLLKSNMLVWAVKIIAANLAVVMLWMLADNLFGAVSAIPIGALVLLFQVAFIVYDIVYGMAIKYYIDKIRKRLFAHER